jgi:hypothetical protein
MLWMPQSELALFFCSLYTIVVNFVPGPWHCGQVLGISWNSGQSFGLYHRRKCHYLHGVHRKKFKLPAPKNDILYQTLLSFNRSTVMALRH